MKRWWIMTCLCCLGGTLFGVMLLQNHLVRSYQPPSWSKQLDFREAEYAVYVAVIDSDIPKTARPDLKTLVNSYEIINVTSPGWSVFRRSDYPDVPESALADFVTQNKKPALLTRSLKTRIPSRLVSPAESKSRESDGRIAALSFSRVGFDETMSHAVVHMGIDNGTAIRLDVSLAKVDGSWVAHRTGITLME